MSLLPNATNTAPGTYLFLLANASTINTGNLNANFVSTGQIVAQNISSTTLRSDTIDTDIFTADRGSISSISTTSIQIDGNFLDTAGAGFGATLLLNGVPIATTADISSITDWSFYPAVSTVQMNSQSLIDVNNIYASNVYIQNSLTASMGGITVFSSSNITNSNSIMTNTINITGDATVGGTLRAPTGRITNLTTSSITNAFGITAATGVFSSLGISSLTANTANISTQTSFSITGVLGTFSTLNVSSLSVSSIVAPTIPNQSFSTIATQGLQSQSTVLNGPTSVDNLTVNTSMTVTPTPTFNNGGNFNGTRPNFTTGINTSGANNFNFQNIDNVQRITGNNIVLGSVGNASINTSSFLSLTADRGIDVSDKTRINITAQYGDGGIVNITGGVASLLAPVPISQVNILAEGNRANAGNLPIGGKVTIGANAGTTTIALPIGAPPTSGYGEVDITANSFFGLYLGVPVIEPGIIKLAAGGNIIYAGPVPTLPLVVYGTNYLYGSYANYIVAGTPPGALPAFAGTNYIYGSLGTSINNGLYTDNIYSYGTSNLNITAQTGRWVDISRTQALSMGNNPLINFVDNNGRITGLSSINGAVYPPAASVPQNLTVSTLNSLQVNTSSILVSSINGSAYPPAASGGWVSTATSPLNMNGNGIGDNLGILMLSSQNVVSYANTQLIAGVGASPNYTSQVFTSTSINFTQFGTPGFIQTSCSGNLVDIVAGNIQTQATSTINTVPNTFFTGNIRAVTANLTTLNSPQVNTSSILVSSINGSAYPPASTWVSTATTPLNMNGNGIGDSTGILVLSSITVGVLGDDTLLIGAGNTSANYTSIAFLSTSISIAQIGSTDGFIDLNAAGNITTTAAVNITTTAVSTINNVSETYFSGGISRFLITDTIPQPVIQYGKEAAIGQGASGTITVTLPQRYTSVTSYVPFACMGDAPAAELYVSTLTRATFEIGWQNGGGGDHYFNWHTMGT